MSFPVIMIQKYHQRIKQRELKHLYKIQNIRSIGGNDVNEPFPLGTYSSIINIDMFKCIYFHIFLQKPVGVNALMHMNVLIYDFNDNLVSDLSSDIQCEPVYDKFSKGLILRGDDGSRMTTGKYVAKISFGDSDIVTYRFELIENNKKKKGFFRLFR